MGQVEGSGAVPLTLVNRAVEHITDYGPVRIDHVYFSFGWFFVPAELHDAVHRFPITNANFVGCPPLLAGLNFRLKLKNELHDVERNMLLPRSVSLHIGTTINLEATSTAFQHKSGSKAWYRT